MRANYILLLMVTVMLVLGGCQRDDLPTIGRTHGDFPMARILVNKDGCWVFTQKVYFDTPFATGMSFDKNSCLQDSAKIGRKQVTDLVNMHVSLTYDGEYYIIKNGY
ncbi:hypothetical protein [Alteromonas facilis]|uniref:hypothetical protein n=1 Tax=Alteromonas facilis TaxID=2048004 RepID=UPI000C28F3AB|nr:hypothetical protein [Alteromonas facilis]